jgi:hypothetical protein
MDRFDPAGGPSRPVAGNALLRLRGTFTGIMVPAIQSFRLGVFSSQFTRRIPLLFMVRY